MTEHTTPATELVSMRTLRAGDVVRDGLGVRMRLTTRYRGGWIPGTPVIYSWAGDILNVDEAREILGDHFPAGGTWFVQGNHRATIAREVSA
jgi:hypothetical protein